MPSHYLNQWWPQSMMPYRITRSQWVNSLLPGRHGCNLKTIIYLQSSNIRCSKSPNLNASHLVLQLSLPCPLKPGVKNEDVVGARPTVDAPTTSERSIILLPTKVWLILEVWQYAFYELISWVRPVKLLLCECHKTSLMISQHWFR